MEGECPLEGGLPWFDLIMWAKAKAIKQIQTTWHITNNTVA